MKLERWMEPQRVTSDAGLRTLKSAEEGGHQSIGRNGLADGMG